MKLTKLGGDWNDDPGDIISEEDQRVLGAGRQVEEGVLPLVGPQRLRWNERTGRVHREPVTTLSAS